MSTYRVAAGTQVNWRGTVHPGGDTLTDLDADTAATWAAAGWIEPADPPKRTPTETEATQAAD